MALTKVQKQKVLDGLKEKVARQKAMVFADFQGLKVKDLTQLRREMKKNDNELKVAKKTLIAKVFQENKIDINVKKLSGEIVLGFGYKDEISPFKTLHEFSKKHENLKILGGLVCGEIIGKERALELGQLPGREEFLARLFFTAKFPLFGFYNILQRNLSILKVKS